MKRYDIKTTDTETLRKWYYLMSLGRALDEKAPSYLLQSLGWSYHAPYAGHDASSSPSDGYSTGERITSFPTTAIC